MFSNLKYYFNFFKFTKPQIKKLYVDYLFLRPFIWLVFIDEFIFDFYLLEGESMLPTFDSYGNIVIVDKITSNNFLIKLIYGESQKRTYKRGEIVCLNNPTTIDGKICKRIVHLEGDEVKLRNGNKITIPNNHVWVEGDNKENSYDSRSFGPIPLALVLGRVPVQIWPRLKLL
jgi:inner membrane protease subunit 1